jgi:hypothetical protein
MSDREVPVSGQDLAWPGLGLTAEASAFRGGQVCFRAFALYGD